MAIRFMRGHAQNVGAILDGQPLLIREDGKSYYHLHAGIGSNNYAPCAADPNIYQDTSINWAVPNTTANYRIWGTSTGMTIRAVADPSATSTPGIALSTNSSDKNSDEAINWYFTGADFRPGAAGQTMGEVRPFDSGRMTTLKTDNITTSSYATVHIHKTLVPEEISSGITLGTGSAPFYSINTQRIFVHNDDTDDSTACSVWMYAPTASNNAVLTYSPQNGDADQFMLGINYTKGTGYNGTIQLGNFAARTTICGTNLMRFSLRDQVGGSGGGAIAFNGTSMYPETGGSINSGTTNYYWNTVNAERFVVPSAADAGGGGVVVDHLLKSASEASYTQIRQQLPSTGMNMQNNMSFVVQMRDSSNNVYWPGIIMQGTGGNNPSANWFHVRPNDSSIRHVLGSAVNPWHSFHGGTHYMDYSNSSAIAVQHEVASQDCYTEFRQILQDDVAAGATTARLNFTLGIKPIGASSSSDLGFTFAAGGGPPSTINFYLRPKESGAFRYNVGMSSMPWSNGYITNVYATGTVDAGVLKSDNGTVQTSDRAAKSDIHYLDAPVLYSATEQTSYTTQDVLDFIENLQPCVFKYGEGTIQEAWNEGDNVSTQLGLISDDLLDEPLFDFIGATTTHKKLVVPATFDETGGQLTPEEFEDVTSHGLKAVPLAVAALTACKHLLSKVDELENEINLLKSATQ